jgi:soluble lytic murein transglycosylase-like protein
VKTRPCVRSAILAGLIALAGAVPVRAELYYTRDQAGAYHFTSVARPDSAVFRPGLIEPPTAGETARAAAAFGASLDSGAYDELIAESATTHHLDPTLVKAVVRAESAFHPRAISPKGARGLMQLMPATARGLGCRNVYDPAQNIEAGAKHLRALLDQYGNNLPRVLAAYNAGAARVDHYRGIPPYAETRAYVLQVLSFRRQYLRQQRLAAITKRAR